MWHGRPVPRVRHWQLPAPFTAEVVYHGLQGRSYPFYDPDGNTLARLVRRSRTRAPGRCLPLFRSHSAFCGGPAKFAIATFPISNAKQL